MSRAIYTLEHQTHSTGDTTLLGVYNTIEAAEAIIDKDAAWQDEGRNPRSWSLDATDGTYYIIEHRPRDRHYTYVLIENDGTAAPHIIGIFDSLAAAQHDLYDGAPDSGFTPHPDEWQDDHIPSPGGLRDERRWYQDGLDCTYWILERYGN